MNKAISSLYVVRVLPIVRGFRDSEATYFSATSFTPGAIVSVPFRSKEKNAVVLSSISLAEQRSEIKNADFGLRKIKKQKERFLFQPLFLEAVHELALHYATTPGEILSALVPASAFEEMEDHTIAPLESSAPSLSRKRKKRIFIQGRSDVQINKIKKEIKASLRKNSSVLILAATTDEAKRLTDALSPLFPERVIEISSRLTKKNQKEAWREATKQETALVAVVTAGFLSVPLRNVGLCLVYKSNSNTFQGQRKPYLDARVVHETISDKHGATFMSVDVFIPVRETMENEYAELDVLPLTAGLEIIDMTKTAKTTEERLKNEFTLLSKELLLNTSQFLESGKNVFWFVARRGLYPATVCRDCGTEHVCPKCGSSFVLHETKAQKRENHELVGNKNRFFLCHRCGEREDTLITCRDCGSWRLLSLGVGVDLVYQSARELGLSPLVLSQDHTPTKKSIKEIIARYREPTQVKGRLLIGTDLALPHLDSSVGLTAIVSLDSRLALPSYAAEESALKTLLSITSLADELCIIQTRRREHRIFKYADGKGLGLFRKEEAALRKTFLYPPFGTLVEISYTAKKQQVEERINAISADLLGLIEPTREKVIPFPLRGTKKKGMYKGSVVLKLGRSLQNQTEIRNYLMHLSPDMQIRVDPENLW